MITLLSISESHKVSKSWQFLIFRRAFAPNDAKRDVFVVASFSVRENLLVVSGAPETKSLKEMMPDILKQVGPQQYQFLKEQIGAGVEGKAQAADDDDDDVPELVGTFEDVNKWTVWQQPTQRRSEHSPQQVDTPYGTSFSPLEMKSVDIWDDLGRARRSMRALILTWPLSIMTCP